MVVGEEVFGFGLKFAKDDLETGLNKLETGFMDIKREDGCQHFTGWGVKLLDSEPWQDMVRTRYCRYPSPSLILLIWVHDTIN